MITDRLYDVPDIGHVCFRLGRIKFTRYIIHYVATMGRSY